MVSWAFGTQCEGPVPQGWPLPKAIRLDRLQSEITNPHLLREGNCVYSGRVELVRFALLTLGGGAVLPKWPFRIANRLLLFLFFGTVAP